MRKLYWIALAALPMTASAIDFPSIQDATFAAMLERYKADRAIIEAPGFFTAPAAPVTASCTLPEIELYRAAGLDAAHPDLLAKKIERNGRRYMRAVTGTASTTPMLDFRNIRFTVTELPCEGDVANGVIKMFVSYDNISDSTNTSTSGSTTSTTTTHSLTHTDRWVVRAVAKGVVQHDVALYSRMTTTVETHYSDPAVEKIINGNKKVNAAVNRPYEVTMANYTTGHGASLRGATFSLSSELDPMTVTSSKPQFNAVMTTTLISGVDDLRSVISTYRNADILVVYHTKDDAMHGENITYMENVYKKMKVAWQGMPGMEDARETVVNGKDFLETHTCFQDGVPAKMSPCPWE